MASIRENQLGMKQRLQRTAAMFRGHNSSIRAVLVSEVCFGTAISWFNTYRSLYMVALGASELQVGLTSSLLLCSQAVGALLGGWSADRFGRKRTMQFFDTLAWLTSITLWFLASGFGYFVVAALFNGLFFGAIPSWNCVIAGNTTHKRRHEVYGLVHLTFLGSGLFGPIGGWLVARYGIVSGSKVIYALGFMLVLAALAVRQLFVHEAAPETESGEATAVAGPASFRDAFRIILGDRRVTIIILSVVLTNFTWIMFSTYSALYMTNAAGLALPASLISLLPLLNSLSMISVLLLVIPQISNEHYPSRLVLGSGMIAVGTLVFLLTPRGWFWPLGVYALLAAGGGAIVDPVRSSYQANIVPAHAFAKVLSVSSTFMLLSGIPAGPIAGALFRINVRLPFYLVLGLQSCNFLLNLALKRVGKSSNDSAIGV